MTVSFVRSMILDGSGVKNTKRVRNWSEEDWEWYERVTGERRPEFFRPGGKAETH